MSLTEMWCMYSRMTGLPPTGPAYRLVGHVISRFAVPCALCNQSGSKAFDGRATQCAGCGGFRKYLSPAAIRRAHKIVRAAFPNAVTSERTEPAARLWAAREDQPAVRPMYLGVDPLPPSVSRAPKDALTVASLTWRRGLRCELLWGTECELDVVWERLPDLLLPSGEPWMEIFAWTRSRGADPCRSAQRLIQLGWADTNPAYGWLARCRSTGTVPFSVTSPGLLAAGELEWLLRLAVRVRHRNVNCRKEHDSKQPLRSGPRYIGPYPFQVRRPRHPPTPPRRLTNDDPEV
jgi:hypothetical protein